MNTWKFDHTFADLDKFSKFFVGADKFADRVHDTFSYLANSAVNGTYPPFNLKKTEDNKYVVEMAVAGFGRNDIEISLEDNKLIINGKATVDQEENEKAVLHKGISDRPFTRMFTLADNVVINNAALVNGLLKIWLEHVIPENKKPKKIEINEVDTGTSKNIPRSENPYTDEDKVR
jgi:molecular chaperone IbpA